MSQEKRPVRVAIIGTAARSDYLYGPILQALPHEVELVSVWGRSEASAQRLGETLQAPWYTDLDRLVRETAPEIGIVSVAYGANGEVGLAAVEAGLHVLLETPIAHKLSEADAIIAAVHVDSSRGERPRHTIAINRAEACSSAIDRSVNELMNHSICASLSSPPSRLVRMTSRIVTAAIGQTVPTARRVV